jgi:WD40 repeat protein
LSIDPSGQKLASCGNDGRIAIWSIPELKPVQSWQAHENHAYQVAFHPSGKEIVSVDLKGMVRIWDLTGKKIREIEAKALHKYDAGFGADIGGARSMAFSTDGTVLALAGITNVTNAFAGIGNPIILLVDWATGKITKELTSKEKFQGTMWGVAWHPAGFVAGTAGGNGGMLWFWKPDQPNEFAAIKLADNSRDISIAPDGKAVAIPSYGGFARIFDITPNLNPPKEVPKVPPAKK